MEGENETLSTPKRHRRKNSLSSMSFSCCFSGNNRGFDLSDLSPSSSPQASKGRTQKFISRLGRSRRHASADFTYDALSYSRNFDDDLEEFPPRNFSSRLPVSPPRRNLEELPIQIPNIPRKTGLIEANKTSGDQMSLTPTRRRGVGKTILRAEAVAEVRRSLENNMVETSSRSSQKSSIEIW